ncbi:MAG TPA: hypothetical protein VHL57_10015, partial [Flavobacteriales bacterium]|nr:hypothetical protein [Flavobacteriales bacterium]
LDRTIANLTVSGNTLNLNAFTLTYTGTGSFTGGTISNGTLAPNAPSATSTFAGTAFTAAINGSASRVFMNGGTYSAAVTLTKTGGFNDLSTGGCTFNNTLTLGVTGSGTLSPNYTGNDAYNGNLVLSSTGSGGISFGQNTGTGTLATGRTVTIGAAGFSAGDLMFRRFTQVGATAQNLTLTGSSFLCFQTGAVFNGALTTLSNGLLLSGGTFNGASKFTKAGTFTNSCQGGNTFNNTVEFVNSGTGDLNMAEAGVDNYNNNVLVNSTGGGDIRFGNGGGTSNLANGRTIGVGALGFNNAILLFRNFTQTGSASQTLALGSGAQLYFNAGTVFNGAVTATSGQLFFTSATFNLGGKFTKTGPTVDVSAGGNTFTGGNTEFSIASTGTFRLADVTGDQFNCNLVFSSTSTGEISFGYSGGGSALLIGRTMSVGAAGFNTGTLTLRNIWQMGSGAVIMGLGTGATLNFLQGAAFNGPLSVTAGSMFFQGSTFGAASKFTKTGSSVDESPGGATFNAQMEFSNTGTGTFSLASTTGDAYNGNVLFSSTSTGEIRFGYGGGTSVLATTRTLGIGLSNFISGTLSFRNFTQQGATAQSLTLGTAATLNYFDGTVFNGAMTSTSGRLYFSNARFNANGKFTKNGAGADASTGGNIFNGSVEFVLTGSGELFMAEAGADQYNGNLIVNSTGTGRLWFGYAGGTSTVAAGRSISTGASGYSAGHLLFRNVTQLGSASNAFNMGASAKVTFDTGSTFDGPMQATAGSVNLCGSTFQDNSVFTKNGTLADGNTGGCTFNGSATFSNT